MHWWTREPRVRPVYGQHPVYEARTPVRGSYSRIRITRLVWSSVRASYCGGELRLSTRLVRRLGTSLVLRRGPATQYEARMGLRTSLVLRRGLCYSVRGSYVEARTAELSIYINPVCGGTGRPHTHVGEIYRRPWGLWWCGPTHQQCCEIQNKITPLFHNICLLLERILLCSHSQHESAMEYDARLVWKLVHEPDLRPSELRHKSDLPLAITYKQTYDEQVGITEADHTARHLT